LSIEITKTSKNELSHRRTTTNYDNKLVVWSCHIHVARDQIVLNSNHLLISSKIVDWCIPCHITMGYLVRLLYMYSLVIEMALNQHPSDVKFPQFGLSLHVCDNFIQQACYHSWSWSFAHKMITLIVTTWRRIPSLKLVNTMPINGNLI
jgi:hypothetical protein